MFADNLIQKIRETSPICLGLDPNLEMIPECIKRDYSLGNSILKFNEEIIDAISDLVPILKPQAAYYEQYGLEGIEALKITIETARSKGLLVLLDAKRNDIGSTAEAYANAYLKEGADFESDALTVNGYLGSDGILPFTDLCKKNGKGLFILVKTSNPSSGELQDLELKDSDLVYSRMAEWVKFWGQDIIGESGFSSIGCVVGATFPEQAAYLRELLPNQIFLVPGYGAQGATASDILPCFNEYKEGAIINSSRAINYAYKNRPDLKEKQFAEAARDAVIAMKEDIDKALLP
jgi:orotidine-5'-phosphate decarboxylase